MKVTDNLTLREIEKPVLSYAGEWFVAAYAVNVVDEAERLKNLQGMKSARAARRL
jgi:hypothetical protein